MAYTVLQADFPQPAIRIYDVVYDTIESVINTAQETAKAVEMINYQVRHIQTFTMPWRVHKTWRFVVRCFIGGGSISLSHR